MSFQLPTSNLQLLNILLLKMVSSTSALESQQPIYLLRVDRANQLIGLRDPERKRIPFIVDGKPVDRLPVRTKTVRFMSPEGPVIPNDPYGKYCECPPADGKDGRYFKVGPIEEIEKGSLDFGFYKIRLTGKPADDHGRSGLLTAFCSANCRCRLSAKSGLRLVYRRLIQPDVGAKHRLTPP